MVTSSSSNITAASSEADGIVRCNRLTKTWNDRGTNVSALQDLSFSVSKGEIFAVLGPSGCGKSTMLRILAGLEEATSGEVLINGKTSARPGKRCMLLFQEPALFPWRTARQNIEFPLLVSGKERQAREGIAAEMIDRVGLADFSNSYPHQLSKGMQQRVAMAAALAVEPDILLLDEPFAALDVQTRHLMQRFLIELWAKTAKTIILVTHQIEESLLLADRIMMMTARPGRNKREIRVPAPRPQKDGFFSKEFAALREEMLRMFFEEVRL